MSCKVVDINTVIIDDTTYVAVESTTCSNCDLKNTHMCGKVGTRLGCGAHYRADGRYISWKKSNVKPLTTNKFTLINKKKTYKLNFKP